MYNVNDTIAAISTAPVGPGTISKTILRISGSDTFAGLSDIFTTNAQLEKCGIANGKIHIENNLCLDAVCFRFKGPASYTGEDLAEIHIFAARTVVQYILEKLTEKIRLAGPGEFTLRAYLNGKVDLAQAEAVAQIVSSSNKAQLEAAEKLLAGKLSETAGSIRDQMLDILSLIEAGMDFSEEDIEFVTKDKACETIADIRRQLEHLLNSSIRYEETIDMPSIGLAGVPNAGKSSLLNVLLGKDRSIVSDRRATTRDVLTGEIELENFNCTLFDCAGLLSGDNAKGLLDELAQQAAVEALNSADSVVLCVDVTKQDFAEDIAVKKLLNLGQLIIVATKCDLLKGSRLDEKVTQLQELFAAEVIVTSAVSGLGIEDLKAAANKIIAALKGDALEADERIAITQRHRRAAEEAVDNLTEAESEMRENNDEAAAMLIRSACRELSGMEREDIDEEVLERIFSNFCIGK